MRRGMWLSLALAAAVGAVTVATPPAPAQTKKLVFWTHWDQNPDFNKWYADEGQGVRQEDRATRSRWSRSRTRATRPSTWRRFMAKSGAPDIFMGMTHQWCGQYDFCDKMPADLAKIYDENLPKYMVDVGKWKGVRYGIPIEHGNFQQMYINVDMFKKAGLNPDDPPKTFDEWLAAMKKLTIADPKGGEPTQVGFAIRSKGAPGGDHRQVPARSPTPGARGC